MPYNELEVLAAAQEQLARVYETDPRWCWLITAVLFGHSPEARKSDGAMKQHAIDLFNATPRPKKVA